MSVDFLVKLRDAHQQAADALNEELEKHAPPDVIEYDPEKILWTKATGPKGPYEIYPAFQQKPTMTADYTALLEDLKKHKDKLQHGGLFYWKFDDNITVGRKPARK